MAQKLHAGLASHTLQGPEAPSSAFLGLRVQGVLIWQDAAKEEAPVALPSAREGPLVALAFKLEEGRFGQLTYMRIYSGTVRKGDVVTNVASGKRVKASTASPALLWALLAVMHCMHTWPISQAAGVQLTRIAACMLTGCWGFSPFS
jgi:hypothetical protein